MSPELQCQIPSKPVARARWGRERSPHLRRLATCRRGAGQAMRQATSREKAARVAQKDPFGHVDEQLDRCAASEDVDATAMAQARGYAGGAFLRDGMLFAIRHVNHFFFLLSSVVEPFFVSKPRSGDAFPVQATHYPWRGVPFTVRGRHASHCEPRHVFSRHKDSFPECQALWNTCRGCK